MGYGEHGCAACRGVGRAGCRGTGGQPPSFGGGRCRRGARSLRLVGPGNLGARAGRRRREAHALTEEGHAGTVHTLTGPEALTHGQALEQIGAATGRTLRYVPLTPEAFAESMRGAGAAEYTVTWQTGLFRLIREGVNGLVTGTVSEVTGRPARSLKSYATEVATVWR